MTPISPYIAKQVATNLQYHTNFQVIETQRPPKNNTSGCKGICWDKSRHKWLAYLSVHGKRIFLGRYRSMESAVKARQIAEEKYYAPLIAQRDAESEVGNDGS